MNVGSVAQPRNFAISYAAYREIWHSHPDFLLPRLTLLGLCFLVQVTQWTSLDLLTVGSGKDLRIDIPDPCFFTVVGSILMNHKRKFIEVVGPHLRAMVFVVCVWSCLMGGGLEATLN